MNGTTSSDRTNYFETVPTSALDIALWMESDRMGHLLGAIDQKKLDEQRGVVQNEKRQGENQPYGKVDDADRRRTCSRRTIRTHDDTIGSMEDLERRLARRRQAAGSRPTTAPNNATLVLAGDIDAATAKAKVQKYFGDIPPGPPLVVRERWIPDACPRAAS